MHTTADTLKWFYLCLVWDTEIICIFLFFNIINPKISLSIITEQEETDA